MKVEESMSEQVGNPPPPPPPAQPPRRPRVREVSSRFMTPVASHSSSSSSFSPLPNQKQRSSSVQRQRRHLEFELPGCSADIRSISAEPSSSSIHRSTPQQHKLPQNPPQQRTVVVKPFKENAGGRIERSHRPDTPMVSSNKIRAIQQQRPGSAVSAAAKLLQSNGMSSTSSSLSSNQSYDVSDCSESASSCSSDNHDINNENPSVRCSTKSLPDLRPSVSEPDMLPTVSSRLLTERNINNKYNGTPVPDLSKFYVSPCSRSLNLQRSKSDNFWSQSLKSAADPKPAKQQTNSVKMSGGGGVTLPPIASNGKPTCDFARKGKKDEDALTLKLLHNHYLQWRYANAKAEAFIQSQTRQTERSLYSLEIKISELYDSVKRKRIELSLLQRMKILSTIVEAQMPHLEEWSDFEPVYSTSLSEAIRALLNASFQLPTSANVRVDVKEVEEALNSAMKLMESIALHIQSFIPKAEETENLMSELARVTGEEKAMVEECGDQLSIAHKLQVGECSLHAQLVQLHRSCHGQLKGVVQ